MYVFVNKIIDFSLLYNYTIFVYNFVYIYVYVFIIVCFCGVTMVF